MDRTEFWIGYRKAQLIIIIEPNKLFCMINPNNCDYIILIECIGSADETIPPILLVSGVNILYKWCQHKDLEGDIVIYANNDRTLKWL